MTADQLLAVRAESLYEELGGGGGSTREEAEGCGVPRGGGMR